MDGSVQIALWWAAFGASHIGLTSRPVRAALVTRLGSGPYLAAYSLLSLALIVPLVRTYLSHRHEGPVLWVVPAVGPVGVALIAGNVLAFVMIAGGLATPSPAAPGSTSTHPRGIHYITRHGLFMGVSLWALLHAIANGFTSDVLFFGGFVVVGLLGCWHQDRRKLADGGETFRSFHAQTPFFPFTGPNTLRGIREFSILALIVGVGVAVVLRVYHGALFGG